MYPNYVHPIATVAILSAAFLFFVLVIGIPLIVAAKTAFN